MSDELNGQNDGNHPPHRSDEVFVVVGTMVFNTDDVGPDHRDKRQSGRGVKACRGGKESGHKTDEVTKKDKDKNSGGQGKKPSTLFAANGYHKVFQSRNQYFKYILNRCRHQLGIFTRNPAKTDKNAHHNPHVNHMHVAVSKMAQTNQLKQLYKE